MTFSNFQSVGPSGNYIANRSLGCYKDDKKHRLLPSFYTNFKETNSPKKCIQVCLQSGYLYAGVQYSTECFCGNNEPAVNYKLSDPNCNMVCLIKQFSKQLLETCIYILEMFR